MTSIKKKIYYWSPALVDVATNRAVINSAYSLKKYNNNIDCSITNFFGEFQRFKNEIIQKKITLLNFYGHKMFNLLPKHGKIQSRFSYFIIFILSFFPLKKITIYYLNGLIDFFLKVIFKT